MSTFNRWIHLPGRAIYCLAIFICLTAILLILIVSSRNSKGDQPCQDTKTQPDSGIVKIIHYDESPILLLNDGKEIYLNSATNWAREEQDSNLTYSNYERKLIIKGPVPTPDDGTDTTAYNNLIIPPKSHCTLVLPDKTEISLNAESNLYFPAVFKGKIRYVELIGQAYIQVGAGRKQKPMADPLYVTLRCMTKPEAQLLLDNGLYNVSAYKDDSLCVISVLQGHALLIEPALHKQVRCSVNQQISMTKNGNSQIDVISPAMPPASWTQGFVYFHNTPFNEVMQPISRAYGVAIKYSGDIRQLKFTGKVPMNRSLDDVMKLLQSTGTISWSRVADTVFISQHNQNTQ